MPAVGFTSNQRRLMGAAAIPVQIRQTLMSRLAKARARTDELFAIVRPEAFYDTPIPERHRVIFYLGHLETFDWNLLGRDVFGLDPFHQEFDRLFALGIDPVSGKMPTDQPSDWPGRPEIEAYKHRLRQTLDACLELASLDNPAQALLQNGFLLQVAIEHRLMHTETLAYMLHQLPLDRKVERPIVPAPAAPPVKPRMVEIPAGSATLGLPRNAKAPFGWAFGWDPFGWDNEFEAHRVDVPTFAIDAYNVTNADYLNFERAGGYEHRSLWTHADWEWKQARGVNHPVSWKRGGDQWFYQTMFAEMPLPLDWPVYVTHARLCPTLAGMAKRCPPRPSCIAPPTAHETVWNALTRGDTNRQTSASGTLTSSAGIRSPWGRIPPAPAPSVWPTCWAMVGSGRAQSSGPLPGSNHFRFIRATPPTSLTASTTLPKAGLHAPLRACCADPSATGF